MGAVRWRRDDGVAVVEYGLLLALVAAAVSTSAAVVGTSVNGLYGQVCSVLAQPSACGGGSGFVGGIADGAADDSDPGNGKGKGKGNGNGKGNGTGGGPGNGTGGGGGNATVTSGKEGTQVSSGGGTANNANSGQAGGQH